MSTRMDLRGLILLLTRLLEEKLTKSLQYVQTSICCHDKDYMEQGYIK